jgi:acetolactate synthase I/II/III large subunit
VKLVLTDKIERYLRAYLFSLVQQISPRTIPINTYTPPPTLRKQIIPLREQADAPEPAYDSSFVGLSGGQIFHDMMIRHGVKCIFGYPGGAILPVFDAIYNSKQFEFILPRHEQGAGHMAEGYARASGKPGVVLVTSGPGATNAITPMQDALSDGTPMIVFTGQVPTSAIGTDAFQEADVVGISRACTKVATRKKNVDGMEIGYLRLMLTL